MPYIKKERRASLISGFRPPAGPGELSFMLTLLAKRYIYERGLSYQIINDVLGALEGAKLEFYRRVAAPYERTKIRENGDVYD